jgi:hypothetical protein
MAIKYIIVLFVETPRKFITATRLLTACSKLVDNLGQAVRTQLVDGLLADLLQDVRFLRV